MQPLGVDEPTAIGPYRLLGRLGSGGMGRVYVGRSAGGRTVAVKIVHPHFALDEEFRARFRREVESARRVGGAWTAPVLDADPEAAVPWVATGYAAGPSLSAAVADSGALPSSSVRALGAGLAEALAAVHELGLVHRDVKPSNVLLTLDGPLLIDFGIARATDGTASLTSTGVSIGSPGYMSPEQILGKGITGAADVFSLGAVLAYAATGEPPFSGDSSAALLYKVVHEEPELGPLDGEMRELVEACLAKDPGARPTPGEVGRRLAPDGAARLVAGGWLPGGLVEQVSRSAVQLLNLDAVDTGAADVASGLVDFSRPATVGEFGPPPVMPVMPGSGVAASGAPGSGAAASGASTPVPPSVPPAPPPSAVPEPRDAVPRDATPASGDRLPGKLSLSVAAASTPGEDGRGRRMSCTVALAVAGALAAVTVGSVFVFELLPGGDQDTNAGSDSASSSQAPGKDASTAPVEGSVPARYLGTWEGKANALDGALPAGTFRLTVHKADVGEELGTLRATDLLGLACNDVLTLKKVTAKELVVTSVGRKTNHAGCNPKPHTVRITPTGDDLLYTSESDAEGNPEARLSKVE
ncbi:serine/threonine-protein kinase [Streptomyces viridochromogenes]|uniref:serine/threonine-protein kinase n=1 Tax=Streptomyces viridochromogenes TaxID=1938 RepID=UPI00069F6672|nr:serine/threonine-protein kinase [Streptomyces viridochromogenes]KOG09228.1 serine/threonine protein kinase [Streptomyces viridochromogenes]KOG25280.1 serine/threonine protein kinase [Streptomyces viridochromogenes]